MPRHELLALGQVYCLHCSLPIQYQRCQAVIEKLVIGVGRLNTSEKLIRYALIPAARATATEARTQRSGGEDSSALAESV